MALRKNTVRLEAAPAETFRVMPREATPEIAGSASVIVVDTNGHRTRIELKPVPFKIGRQPDSHLILRDSRASRNHAQIILEDGQYVIEDCGSRHGVHVNGERVERQRLRNSDRIEFGGTICLAIATASDAASRKARILGGREWVRLGAVEMGLDCLRRYLQGLPVVERIDFEKAEQGGGAR